ncbi:MAG: TlpA disulfide reductase family protein [Sedimenticola sp.]
MLKRIPIITAFFMAMLITVNTAHAGTLGSLQAGDTPLEGYTGQGKWLVVMLWASACHVCDEEIPHYNALHLKRHAKDLQVLGISLDGKGGEADAQAFLQRHDVKFTNLLGEPAQVAGLYSSQTGSRWLGTPSFLLYSPTGELMARQAGAVPVESIESFVAKHSEK